VTTKKNINTDINIKGILNNLEDTTMEQVQNTNNNTNIDTTLQTNYDNNIKTNTKFVIKKKVDDKKDKKAFNVYMPDSLVKDLDRISKKSCYSRNELINLMCEYCVNNIEIVEE
jgi:hypothetical protein